LLSLPPWLIDRTIGAHRQRSAKCVTSGREKSEVASGDDSAFPISADMSVERFCRMAVCSADAAARFSQRDAVIPHVAFWRQDSPIQAIRCSLPYPGLLIEDRIMHSGSRLFALCAIDETPDQARSARCPRSGIKRELCRRMGRAK
jgi:hypothetical protein